MRNLLLLFVFASYLALGATAPFVATLGYLWVDLAAPQAMGYSFLHSISFAMILGVAAIFFFVAFESKKNLRPTAIQILLLIFAGWVTLTSTWSLIPEAAWWKWDWATKTILFAFFAPYVINNRVRIEAFLMTFILSISVNYLPLAAKTILTGGRYGSSHTVMMGNSKIAESSSMAMATIMILPLIYVLYKHNTIFPKNTVAKVAALGFGLAAPIAMYGTFARTGLIALTALIALQIPRAKHKILIVTAMGLTGLLIASNLTGSWVDRMETIKNPTSDSSASARLAVWAWTYDFVKENPFGGGFEVYRINRLTINVAPDPITGEQKEIVFERGRAFHSMYFEVLGEHGYIGLLIYLTMFFISIRSLYRVYRDTRGIDELRWLQDYSIAAIQFTIILLVGGSFIGIAFQPIALFSLSIGVMLSSIHKNHPSLEQG
jgi:probable O-glycosylation ligase (exosortase A-associated)